MSRRTQIDVKDFMKQYNKKPVAIKETKYVTVFEYSDIVGMHPVTIRRVLARGEIEGAVKIGGRWRIPLAKN